MIYTARIHHLAGPGEILVRIRILQSLALVLGPAALVLAACAANRAPDPSDPDLDLLTTRVVLQVPGMEGVHADTGNVFRTVGGAALRYDFYRPLHALPRAPVVVFVNGVGAIEGGPPLRKWGIYRTWARLAAASGIAAVLHDSRATAPLEDLDSLVAALRARAGSLGIDPDDIAIWACSANLRIGSAYALNPAHPFVKCAVFYYGNVDTSFTRPDLPVLVARAGLDMPFMNLSLDDFTRRSLRLNAPITVVNLPNARHGFDLFDDNEISREAVRTTVGFLKSNLDRTTQAARGERAVMVRAIELHRVRDWPAALDAAEAWLRAEPHSGYARNLIGDARYNLRRFREAAEIYEQAGTIGYMPSITFYNAGCSWAKAGDKDRAITNLEKAVATGYVTDRQALMRDEDLAPLRDDPRFRRLVEARADGP